MARPAKFVKKEDFTSLIEALKSVGIVAGSLGSVAVLFFWIGNAIIVARLRAYNLYGIVHYTDEYVTEAGYQFFQDIFTFFQDWKLLLLFAALTTFIVLTIPVGPFVPREQENQSSNPLIRWLCNFVFRIHNRGMHYFTFLALAVSASLILTSNLPVERLSYNIIAQERLLAVTADRMKGKLLLFTPRPSAEIPHNEFKQRYYDYLNFGEEPTRAWLVEALAEFGAEFGNGAYELSDDRALKEAIRRFQADFDIREGQDFRFDNGDFGKSLTYQTLLKVHLNNKLNKALTERVHDTLNDIRQLLGAHLTSEEDFSSLVVIPANYELANDSIQKVKRLRENILYFFKSEEGLTRQVMEDLDGLRPIRFGHFLLSYSFWVLVGILVYLLLNSPRVSRFKLREIGYFIIMALMFLTIAVALPTAYGRYRFEFKIQKLNDIVLAGDEKGLNPVREKLDDLKSRGTSLYILGPTKGKEVIVGAIKASDDAAVNSPQIIMLERDSFKLMTVEPVSIEEIPRIIKLLRQGQTRG